MRELQFTLKVGFDQAIDSPEFRDQVISRLLSSGVTGRHQLDNGHFYVLLGGYGLSAGLWQDAKVVPNG